MDTLILANAMLFLSTLSLRRATQVGQKRFRQKLAISIHALLAESDEPPRVIREPTADFYPRSPCGERHPRPAVGSTGFPISIHALLAESDASVT